MIVEATPEDLPPPMGTALRLRSARAEVGWGLVQGPAVGYN